MKINKIILENFRSYYGKHEIQFSTDDNKSLTLFIGENGSGKTSMLNAIFWAFTGNLTAQLRKEEEDSKQEVLILNSDAAEEKKICQVEIEFEKDQQKYILIRRSSKTKKTDDR